MPITRNTTTLTPATTTPPHPSELLVCVCVLSCFSEKFEFSWIGSERGANQNNLALELAGQGGHEFMSSWTHEFVRHALLVLELPGQGVHELNSWICKTFVSGFWCMCSWTHEFVRHEFRCRRRGGAHTTHGRSCIRDICVGRMQGGDRNRCWLGLAEGVWEKIKVLLLSLLLEDYPWIFIINNDHQS